MDSAWLCQMAGVFVLMPPLAGALALGMREARRARLRAQEASADADRSCAACGERDVPLDEDDVYVCPACGYEGGPGLARREARRRREALAALPPEERERTGREALAEARRLLDEAEPALNALRKQLWRPNHYETVAASRLEDAAPDRPLGQVAEACAWLERAGVALGRERSSLAPDTEPGMWIDQLGQLDLRSVVADLDRALESVRRAREEIRVLEG